MKRFFALFAIMLVICLALMWQEREARVAARRRKLIAEGKLEEEVAEAPEPEIPPTPEGEIPTRVPQSASVADRMAARRERYKRAKEEGKI